MSKRLVVTATAVLIALAPAPGPAQQLPENDHRALKLLLEDGPDIRTEGGKQRRIDQWLISGLGCQTFVQQRAAWSPRTPNSVIAVTPAEIRWNNVGPAVAEGSSVRVKPHQLSGEFRLYARTPALAQELARRMNRLRAACAGYSGRLWPWPHPGEGPDVPPSVRFNFMSDDTGFTSCRFVTMPQLRLSGKRSPYEAGVSVTAAESEKVVVNLTLSAEAAQGQAGGTGHVSITGYDYDQSNLPVFGDFPVTATLDGRSLAIGLRGSKTRSGFRIETGRDQSFGLARQLFGGGQLVLAVREASGAERMRFTFDLPKGALIHLRAAHWGCS